jgi:Polyketide cyclase / dehydrase and lipid transport
MQFESIITINASAAKVFAIYADVANWPQWDTDAKSASIQGAFVSGAVGRVVPHGGPASTITFQEVRPNQGFTVTCKLPLCVMRFDYKLLADNEHTTTATHTVQFEGLLAPLFGRLIGSGMKKSLPKTMQQLKTIAQQVR